jgi:hypothetical protein
VLHPAGDEHVPAQLRLMPGQDRQPREDGLGDRIEFEAAP